MMTSRGLKISEQALEDFFTFIKKVRFWFPVGGSLTLPDCITSNAVLAWRKLPSHGTKGTTLSGVRQTKEESSYDLISLLEEAVQRMMPPSERTDMLLKQLAWENANALC